MFVLILLVIIILLGQIYAIFQRYAPVYGVPCIDIENEVLREKVVLLDVRDYNIAANKPVEGVFHLPHAYLKRHYEEIKGKEIVVVVSDRLLLNLSVRFLRRKGFKIVGCYMTACQDQHSQVQVYEERSARCSYD
jgi:rhodanese-related sulfurtransferase